MNSGYMENARIAHLNGIQDALRWARVPILGGLTGKKAARRGVPLKSKKTGCVVV